MVCRGSSAISGNTVKPAGQVTQYLRGGQPSRKSATAACSEGGQSNTVPCLCASAEQEGWMCTSTEMWTGFALTDVMEKAHFHNLEQFPQEFHSKM
jgi:hypothetical protein